MNALNLPKYSLKIKTENRKEWVLCAVRKKYVLYTPEENIRQTFINYLHYEKGYSFQLMKIETALNTVLMRQRSDIMIFNRNGHPLMIVECKAPSIKISIHTFEQIAKYNLQFRAPYLVVTNGMQHFCYKTDFEKKKTTFINAIPSFNEIYI